MSTLHAEQPADAVNRLETLVLSPAPSFRRVRIRTQIASAVNRQSCKRNGCVVARGSRQRRRGDGLKDGDVALQELFAFRQVGVPGWARSRLPHGHRARLAFMQAFRSNGVEAGRGDVRAGGAAFGRPPLLNAMDAAQCGRR